MNIAGSAILLCFITTDFLVLTTIYEENTFKNLVDKKIILDSILWKKERAEIVNINKIDSAGKNSGSKVSLGIEYTHELNSDRKTYNLVNIPYLLLIGTTKEVGDSITIVYNKSIKNTRSNAIYLPTKKDLLDIKRIKGIKLSIFMAFLFFPIREQKKRYTISKQKKASN